MRVPAPLRRPAFRLLLAGRAADAFGNAFATFALTFAVLDLTGRTGDAGLVVGVRTLLNVVFLLFGGVLADRLPKNLLMVGANLVAALTQGTVATLVLTGSATVPLLVALAAVNGSVAAVAMPASASLLPRTVAEDERQQANALNRLSLSTAMIIGAPLGGVLVAVVGPGWAIAADGGTFLVSACCFALIRLPAAAAERPPAKPGVLHELRTGWTEFRSHTWLWVVVAGACVMNMAWSGATHILGPAVAAETIGRPAWGVVLAVQTAGMIAGSLLAMRLRLRRFLRYGVIALTAMAGPLIVLGLDPHLVPLAGAAFLAGVALEIFSVGWETTMQEHIPADRLARVYSYDMVGSFLAVPVGEIAIGPLADRFGPQPTLLGAAAVLLLAVVGMVSSSDVRNRRHRLPGAAPGHMEESVS
ncbi:MFS family permease [Actinoplanes octamycinicus]|uniref:MFS family permease n=1 Tax=Actinoplanes octamycinicus TaxID=135948 RepID=A0A7W7GTY6_9ACTN|nr:MFS transporter [Actinoplanes octamycinicus]MBB4738246.1 MFS family permease [Actinoplanes octamycinicus]GIE59193.1 MFS transporter [Actinoplanes octamycinicus]